MVKDELGLKGSGLFNKNIVWGVRTIQHQALPGAFAVNGGLSVRVVK